MIALYDFVPKFCPSCGKQALEISRSSLADFNRKRSFNCKCGIGFQYCETESLRHTAYREGGDLAKYH